MRAAPEKTWWTARELAEEGLPDMPATRQNVEAMAKRLDWRAHPEWARRRKGRGGGWEYNWQLLPVRARRKLLQAGEPEAREAPDARAREAQHAAFDALPGKVKTEARRRLGVLQRVGALERGGMTRFLAVEMAAGAEQISARTIWNWFSMVDLVPESDWLFYLAPRHRLAWRKVVKAKCSRRFMELLKSDYLRLAGPSFASCYERAVEICKAEGKDVLTERTARRRLNEEVPRVTQVFAREGDSGLQRCFPAQIRDRSGLHALEGVNADCHKMDVFVLWPGDETPSRAQIVGFQDIYSGKILSWRVDTAPNAVAVMAAFGDMIEGYGIPNHVLFDNGHEFANKWLSGGTPTRFRFKVRDDDPLGVLPILGIQVHWATPAHGQAKPVERAFRDFADHIAKDPRFAGAYTGNSTLAKPEDYGSRAIPIEEFIRVVGEGVKRHNARTGRRSPTAKGRSLDETFAESYARATIRKATDEQRRLWLMGQASVKLTANAGEARLHGNVYWSDWMNEYAGQKMVVRFDPEDLHAGLHIYDLDGSYQGFAACREAVGFFDLAGARELARQRAQIRRTEKKLLEQHRSLKAAEIGAALDAAAPDAPEPVEAKVVQMLPGKDRPEAARVRRPEVQVEMTEEERTRQALLVTDFEAERDRRKGVVEEEGPREMFARALDIERRAAAGERIGDAEANWLMSFRESAAYRAERALYESYGDEMFLK